MAIDFEAAMKTIKESNGKTFFEVTLPSTKKKVQMNNLTVGMKKTLAKLAMAESDKDYVQFKMAQLSLIKSLDIKGEINTEELKEVDFLSVITQIVNASTISNISFKVPCQNPKCDGITQATVNFDLIISALDTINGDFKKTFSRDIDGHKFEFELDLPRISDSIVLESLKVEGMNDIEYDLIFPYLFIQNAKLDGEYITFNVEAESTIMGKIKLLESLSTKLTSGSDSLISFINESYKNYGEILEKASQTVICSKCKKEIRGMVNADSFFLY